MLREALEAARAIGDEWYRSQALAALAPHLTEPLLREALEAARAIGDEGRSQALAALAPHLAELGHLGRGAGGGAGDRNEWDRSRALAALAPHLGPTERDRALGEALEAARAIETSGPGPRRWPRWPPT